MNTAEPASKANRRTKKAVKVARVKQRIFLESLEEIKLTDAIEDLFDI